MIAGLINQSIKNLIHRYLAYDLPPNSNVTGVKCFAAASMTILPTVPLPV